MQELIALQEEVYKGNEARGFWEGGKEARHFGEAVALIVTELSEAIEGHRKGRNADESIRVLLLTDKTVVDSVAAFKQNMLTADIEYFKPAFEEHIKDTWQTEIAGAVVRILDVTHGFSITLTDMREELKSEEVDIPENFAEKMLGLIRAICDSYYVPDTKEEQDEAWSLVLSGIQVVADLLDVDLLTHVKLELKYNSTRPFKHGKKY